MEGQKILFKEEYEGDRNISIIIENWKENYPNNKLNVNTLNSGSHGDIDEYLYGHNSTKKFISELQGLYNVMDTQNKTYILKIIKYPEVNQDSRNICNNNEGKLYSYENYKSIIEQIKNDRVKYNMFLEYKSFGIIFNKTSKDEKLCLC